ncbi:MAG: M48 family metallopeptidase [Candidatus Paceibacterota bacterium]
MYIFKNYKRSKHIRITVRPDRTVLITKPPFVSKERAELFALSKGEWIQEQLRAYEKEQVLDVGMYSREHYLLHRDKARMLIESKIERWNKIYDYSFKSIRIKNMTTRWGSCSTKGNLNFNYKLLFLSDEFVDYVVVHELCHLKEFNHSQNFWKLVEETIPQYKKIKKELHKIK